MDIKLVTCNKDFARSFAGYFSCSVFLFFCFLGYASSEYEDFLIFPAQNVFSMYLLISVFCWVCVHVCIHPDLPCGSAATLPLKPLDNHASLMVHWDSHRVYMPIREEDWKWEGTSMPGRERKAVVMTTDEDASMVLTRRWDEARTLQDAPDYFKS